jgi:carboxymethylenebutenolidase
MTEVSIGAVPGGSTALSGYLARPSGAGPWPAIVAIHEIFGLDDQFRRHCDRLAAAGYLTLGLNLFSDGGPRRCIVTTMRALFRGRGKPVADIDAARRYLAESADSTGKVGIIGFCMGGGFALLCAPRGFDVASANYGQAPAHPAEHFQDACPVVASYGGRDPLMLGQAKRVEKGLTAAGIPHDFKVYPGVGHSFLNDEMTGPRALQPIERVLNVGPRPEAAQDAWARIEKYFDTYLR